MGPKKNSHMAMGPSAENIGVPEHAVSRQPLWGGGRHFLLSTPNPERGGGRALLNVRNFSWAILLRKTRGFRDSGPIALILFDWRSARSKQAELGRAPSDIPRYSRCSGHWCGRTGSCPLVVGDWAGGEWWAVDFYRLAGLRIFTVLAPPDGVPSGLSPFLRCLMRRSPRARP
jgi:hypothetical protein